MHRAHAFDDARHVARLEEEATHAGLLHAEALRRVAAHLDRPRRVVDLGCGPGTTSVLLARTLADARVVAADGAPRMLARAAEVAERTGLASRIVPREVDLDGDLSGLGTVDLVWASLALHHAADERATLRAIRELLAPGPGLLCVVDVPHGVARRVVEAGFDVVEERRLAPERELVLARPRA